MGLGAGAAALLPRNRAALALIVGLHVLALLAWMRQRPAPLPDVPHVVTILLRPSLPRARPRPAVPAEPGYPRPRRRSLPPVVDFFATPPAAPPPPSAPTAQPAAPAAAPSAPQAARLEDAHAPISVEDAIREQREAGGGFGLALSKRQAGRIDRELRAGKSGVPDQPDTPMGRLGRGLEAAHIERSLSVHEDSYTLPDGTVYYRKRIGNASFCRRSGSVSPLGMRGMVMGNEAGDVPCPRGVIWKRD